MDAIGASISHQATTPLLARRYCSLEPPGRLPAHSLQSLNPPLITMTDQTNPTALAGSTKPTPAHIRQLQRAFSAWMRAPAAPHLKEALSSLMVTHAIRRELTRVLPPRTHPLGIPSDDRAVADSMATVVRPVVARRGKA